MPSKSKKAGSMTSRYKKQHGLHQKRSKPYLKVYWPYLPVLLFVIVGIGVSVFTVSNKYKSSSEPIALSVTGIVNQTNQQRAESNLNTLTLSTQLDTAAQSKANDMVANNYWSHNSPSGQTPWQFIEQNGYGFSLAGENLAYGFNTSTSILSAWMNSPDHRANILDPNYKNIGIGIASSPDYRNSGPETVVVAMYASPSGSVLSAKTNKVSSGQPFTSISAIQPNSKAVGRIETLTTSNAVWTVFATGLIGGAAVMFLAIRHGLIIKRWARESEQFVFEHPFIDVGLVLVIATCAALNQTIGFIR